MSSLEARHVPPIISLACLLDRLVTDPTLPEHQRREMTSAINTVTKVLKAPPNLILAAPDQLREQLNRALPTAVGVSPDRFRNVKSLLRKALAKYDPQVIPARSRAVLSLGWANLLEKLDSTALERGLARFSKYCSGIGISPEAVTQAVYDRFYADLEAHCLIRSPRETQQTAGRAWNTAVKSIPGWPQTVLVIANHRRNPSLPWSAFPESLVAEIEAYLAPRSAGKSRFLTRAPKLRESTIAGKRNMLRQHVTSLVQSGWDPGTFHSLADIVTLEAVDASVQLRYERAGNEDTKQAYNISYMLYGIAKHWLKLDPKVVAEFKEGCKTIRPKSDGMTAKNRLRLKQFENWKNLKAQLDLPGTMMREACRSKKPTKAEARIALVAVAMEILLSVPLRIKNVSELELGRTLLLSGKTGTILIDLSEVKNEVLIEAPLPAECVRMINVYLKRFHPLLAPPGCKMLFPSADGGHRRTTVLSTSIKKCIARRCGLEMNAHLFRHLAAWLLLDANPGAYGLVRMLLGHKSVDTTTRAYCNKEMTQAFRLHDANIAKLRAGGGVHTPGHFATLEHL